MKKLILVFFIYTVSVSYGYPAINGVACKVNDITVETKTVDDCKAIGGKALDNYLFVINFDNGSFDGKRIQLNGNGKSNAIYFTDRPERKAGHMGVKKFKSIWTQGINSFKSNPPNATLSLVVNGEDSDSVMTLLNPKVKNSSLLFDVKLIHGSIPEKFNTGGLFIDNFGPCPGC